jgi:hypothetical protein
VPETTKASVRQSGLAQAGAARTGEARTDGKQPPLQIGLTAFTLLAGIIAFVAGLIVRQHLAATVLGLASLVVGLYTQMISVTRPQRIFLMAGVVPAFVGLCLGLAHSGLS